MEYELKHIEGNEYALYSFGVHIADIYTSKDTYVFDIQQMVDEYNKKGVING